MKDAMDKKPKKLKSEKMPIWAIPEILPFLSLRFINLLNKIKLNSLVIKLIILIKFHSYFILFIVNW